MSISVLWLNETFMVLINFPDFCYYIWLCFFRERLHYNAWIKLSWANGISWPPQWLPRFLFSASLTIFLHSKYFRTWKFDILQFASTFFGSIIQFSMRRCFSASICLPLVVFCSEIGEKLFATALSKRAKGDTLTPRKKIKSGRMD